MLGSVIGVRALARRAALLLSVPALVLVPSVARAQNIISVPFTNGFIGTRGSSAGTANNVLTFATLGISRIFFIQSSSTSTFELQGNDLPGTMRIVRTNGTTLDIPASCNWRNSGGTTYLIGILPRPASPITFAYSGGSIQITDGSANGGSSVGGYVAAHSGSTLADGASTSGNAALSQVLGGLNDYLGTVVSSRPAGPVTVTALTTSSTTPTLAGTATLVAGEALSVVVNGVQYTTTTSPALAINGTAWSLPLSTALATGTYAVTATITNGNGFTLSDATTNELVITAPATSLTLAGSFTANDRVYDGTTTATGSTGSLSLVGVAGGHQVTITSVSLAFQTASVGAGKTVTITAVTLGGTNASQYSVDLTGAPTATAEVTTAPLTITGVSVVDKTYDGALAATLTGTAAYAGLASGESFAVTGTPVASFATPGVGTGKPVTVSGYTAPSANYSITQPAALTGNIVAKVLTIAGSFTASDKLFDGTTAATIATNALTLVGVVPSETVTLAGETAVFSDAGIATGKTVSLSSASLSGGDAGNYALSLAGAPTTTAAINSNGSTVTVSGSFTASDKVYDRGTVATGNTAGLTLVGVAGGDQVTIASVTLAFQSATVGTGKTVVVAGITLGGANSATYGVSLAGSPTATAAITAVALTVGGSFTSPDKSYDGNASATIATNALALSGVLSGDVVTIAGSTATFSSAAVGNAKTVSLSGVTLGGAQAGNYTVSLAGAPTTTASITATGGAVTISGSFTAHNKTYDGTLAATGVTSGLTLSGVAGGHQVTIAAVSLAFQSSSVGAGKTVVITSVALGGADAALYSVSLSCAPTATASITPRRLTIHGAAVANKVYDRTTDASLAQLGSYVGLALGEQHAIAGTPSATFATFTVGNAKPVVVTGYAAPNGNYVVEQPAGVVADIAPRPLTLGGSFSAPDKSYDGTSRASIAQNGLTLVGVLPGDEVTLGAVTVTFADPAVASGKTVGVAAVALGGAHAASYVASLAGAPTTTASILAGARPSAPRNVIAVAGNGSIALTWRLPEVEGCAAVSSYSVEYSTDGGATWIARTAIAAPALSATIPGAVNNRAYLVRISASNPCGAGPYAETVGPIVPVAPTPDGTGRPATVAPGGASGTSGGNDAAVTTEVVEDSLLRLTSDGLDLRLRAADPSGAVIPIDSSRTLQLEDSGTVVTSGSGFAPGSFVTVYMYGEGLAPTLLATVPVGTDGTFASTATIPPGLKPGPHTIQVNGIDARAIPRSMALGVEVAEPAADLSLTATPDVAAPAIGDTITITLTVTNHGRGPAIDVVIPRAFREPGFEIIATRPIDGTFDEASREWFIARIEPGAAARLLLTAIVLPRTTTPGATP